MKIFRTKKNRAIFRIEKNADGTLSVFREYYSTKNMSSYEKDGLPYKNAGMLIFQQGGIDALLAKCEDVDNLDQLISDLNTEKKAIRERANQQRMRQMIGEREKAKADYDRVFGGNDIVESNADNIRTLLAYLNTVNWGVWELPKMSIGYQCSQYDCDGKTATTIKLDEPIMYYGEPASKFQYGAPRGHLTDYVQIR